MVLVIAAPAYAVFQFDETRKVMVDTGLSTALLAGVLVALIGPVRAMAYELEDRTALSLLSKPMSRWTLVAGKYLGITAAAATAAGPMLLASLYVVRIAENAEDEGARSLAWPVVSVLACAAALAVLGYALLPRRRILAAWLALMTAGAGGLMLIGPFDAWRWEVFGAGVLVLLEVAVVAAAATAAAARFGAVGTLSCGLGLMLAGHARNLLGPERLADPMAALLGLLPGLEAHNGIAAAAAGQAIPATYLLLAGLHALLYVMALLLVGAALLQRREVA